MNYFLWDLRQGLRRLLKQPSFSAVAVTTLALTIGLNTTIFSLVHAYLLRPSAFPDGDRIAFIYNFYGESNALASSSPPDYLDRKKQSKTLEAIGAFWATDVILRDPINPSNLRAAVATASLFEVLGITPMKGRLYTPEEEQDGENLVALLTETAWQRHFAGDPDILGREIDLNGRLFKVIGIIPKRFDLPFEEVELFIPLVINEQQAADDFRGNEFLSVLGCFKPQYNLVAVEEEMKNIAARVMTSVPDRAEFLQRSGWSARVESLRSQLVGDVKPMLMLLWGAVFLVLLIGCVNVANLLYAKGVGRRKDIATRIALGATRSRTMRLLLIESMLLAFTGAALGLLLTAWCLAAVPYLVPEPLPFELQLNSTIFAFTLVLALLTGLIFGFAPSWHVSNIRVADTLKESGRGSAGPRQNRLRAILVTAQLTTATALLIGTGLFLKSFSNLLAVQVGFQAENVSTFKITLPSRTYPDSDFRLAFFQQFEAQLSNLPGVQQAALSHLAPFEGSNHTRTFQVEALPEHFERRPLGCEFRVISPNFFKTLQIPLLKGRDFSHQDHRDQPLVAVVNQHLAQTLWPNQSALGKRISLGNDQWQEIVGVVANVQNENLTRQPSFQIYVPYLQSPRSNLTGLVKTSMPMTNLKPAIQALIQQMDPKLPAYDHATLPELMSRHLAPRRLTLTLLLVIAGGATFLALLGIYGLLTHSVRDQMQEIGIRMALGATRGHIQKLVMGRALKQTAIGIGLGLPTALILANQWRHLLYDVQPLEPGIYLTVGFLLGMAACIAALLPARRAAQSVPLNILREG